MITVRKCQNCGVYIKQPKLAYVENGPRGPYCIALCRGCFAETEGTEEPLELVEEAAIIAWTPPQYPPHLGWGIGRLAGISALVGCTIAALLMFALSRHEASGVIQASAPAYTMPAASY
jgi:hypothetical protein